MSVTVDANLLVYASNESDPAHARAKATVQELGAGPRLVYLFWPVVVAVAELRSPPEAAVDEAREASPRNGGPRIASRERQA